MAVRENCIQGGQRRHFCAHHGKEDKVWPACVEVQGAHGKLGDLRMNGGATAKGHETAETKNADSQAPSNEKPPGEWNTCEVECSGDAIKLWTNGKLMNQITGCSASSGAVGIQKRKVEKSKCERCFWSR